ncbi:MAG: hypothetical protein R2726_00495 [Acidimicrobiales bacterium]
MGCLVFLAAMLSPRLALFLIWVFGDRLSFAFDSFWIGFIGFLFLPWTALAWAIAYQPLFGVTGFGWFIVGLGLVFDISSWGSGAREQRRRSSPYA